MALDQWAGHATELVENAGPMTEEEIAQFAQAFAELAPNAQIVVLTGSLPQVGPANLYYELLARFPVRRRPMFAGRSCCTPCRSACSW